MFPVKVQAVRFVMLLEPVEMPAARPLAVEELLVNWLFVTFSVPFDWYMPPPVFPLTVQLFSVRVPAAVSIPPP